MMIAMTLSQRNHYFRAGITVSLICLLVAAMNASNLLPLYPGLAGEAARRAPGLLQRFAADLFPAVSQVSFAAALLAAAYALAANALIYFFFEKTHSPEIFFFGLFTLSFSFEFLRLMVPFQELYGFPGFFLAIGSRILFFGRLFGILSLFVSGIYAAGFEHQKQGNLVFAAAIAALVVSMGIPVDVLVWDTSLLVISDYAPVFRLAETGISIISVASFFAAAYTRDSGDYLFIAWGVFFVSIGRSLFINADTWISLVAGLLFLAGGSWAAVSKLHKVYLWL